MKPIHKFSKVMQILTIFKNFNYLNLFLKLRILKTVFKYKIIIKTYLPEMFSHFLVNDNNGRVSGPARASRPAEGVDRREKVTIYEI